MKTFTIDPLDLGKGPYEASLGHFQRRERHPYRFGANNGAYKLAGGVWARSHYNPA